MVKKLLEITQEDSGEIIVKFKPRIGKILSPETKGHLQAAERELLLSLWSVTQEFLKRKGIEIKAEPKSRTKIEVK